MTDNARPRIRTVLITGTSSGIGLHTAVAAVAAGWRVIATMRDTSRSGALVAAAETAAVDTSRLDIRALDVTHPTAALELIERLVAEFGVLDAVVNNAGAGKVGTTETLPISEFQDALETNFLSVVRVTQAALPHLRASNGRVLTVTSVGGVVGQPFNDAYCAAKFAAEGFLESLRQVAATLGVGVAVIEPAAVASTFIDNAGLDRDAAVAEAGPYAPALAAYLERTAGAFASAQPATEVADVIVGALEADELPFRIQTSEGARRFVGMKIADLDGSAVTDFTRTWVA